jgi:hypothetical protein
MSVQQSLEVAAMAEMIGASGSHVGVSVIAVASAVTRTNPSER